jgi:thioredoxin reductase
MEGIDADGGGFVVRTSGGRHRTRTVLLAIGRRGTPRKLDVPGEEQPKVVYRLVDPAQYAKQRVLVVGGGDSALEAAIALAEQPGTRVTLSYRGEAFNRVKGANRTRLEQLARGQRLRLAMKSAVTAIGERDVELTTGGTASRLRNDAVVVCAGGVLPTPLLQSIGVVFETKHGEA